VAKPPRAAIRLSKKTSTDSSRISALHTHGMKNAAPVRLFHSKTPCTSSNWPPRPPRHGHLRSEPSSFDLDGDELGDAFPIGDVRWASSNSHRALSPRWKASGA